MSQLSSTKWLKSEKLFHQKVFLTFFSDEKPLGKFPDKAHIYVLENPGYVQPLLHITHHAKERNPTDKCSFFNTMTYAVIRGHIFYVMYVIII